MTPKILQPPGWPRPKGYANGVAAQGRMVFVSGVIGWDAQGKLVSPHFGPQVRQALQNIVAILGEAGARPEHLVRLNWFVLDKKEYVNAFKEIGEIYRATIGRHYPAMTAVEVSGLLEPGARVEIEATAVIPD